MAFVNIESLYDRFNHLTGDAQAAATLVLAAVSTGEELPAKPDGAALSVIETAQLLGVSAGTVRNLERCGKLPAARIGKGRGTLRFDPALIKTYQREASGNPLPKRRAVR